MCLRAQQRFEKGLSPDHPSTLNTVKNLGNLYGDQGKLVEAETIYQRALQGYEKALGPGNTLHYLPALNTAYNLGRLHSNLGERDEAKSMHSRALVGYGTVFGNDQERCKDVRVRLGDLATHTERKTRSSKGHRFLKKLG